MKREIVVNFLEEKGYKFHHFKNITMNQFHVYNITVLSNESKLILIKEYRTIGSFFDWKDEDQLIILDALKFFPGKFDNNIYFIMVINFNCDDVSLRLEINSIEKNDLICKKYVLRNENDFERIPFLSNKIVSEKWFAFDKKFKEKIKEYQSDNNSTENIEIEFILDDYFNNYLKNEEILQKDGDDSAH